MKIHDILFKYNEENQCTVLIALMENGLVTSFEINQNFTMQDPFRGTLGTGRSE